MLISYSTDLSPEKWPLCHFKRILASKMQPYFFFWLVQLAASQAQLLVSVDEAEYAATLLRQNEHNSGRRRLWAETAGLPKCRSKQTSSDVRLIFIHVFKAAGSSIRHLLREYSLACRRSWGALVECDKGDLVGATSLKCRLKDVINSESVRGSRNRDVKVLEKNPSLEEVRKFDVIGGHLTFAVGGVYPPQYNVHYVTLVREPISSIVSGIRFVHPEFGLDEVIAAVNTYPGRSRFYSNAVNYLSANNSFAEAEANIATMFDVLGLVENYQVSIKLLQLFVDPSLSWKGWFESETKNKSPGQYTTNDILALLDGPTFSRLVNYTRNETQLYETALTAHANTCSAIVKNAARNLRVPEQELLLETPCSCELQRYDANGNHARTVTCSPLEV